MKYLSFLFILSILACKNSPNSSISETYESRNLSKDFKDYWYDGKAELTSYELTQYRYGEKRKGTAVLIFVSEDFLPEQQVKANQQNPSNINVMKLNATKSFNTGIYPYHILESTFLPLIEKRPVLKIASSTQEWCGQTYAQLNHRDNFEIVSHSYFEGEADQNLNISPVLTENELWTRLRIQPRKIETGTQELLPSFAFIRLNHIDIKPYSAKIQQYENEFLVTEVNYDSINRNLKIYQNKNFPFEIEQWEEIQIKNKDTLVTSAKKMERLKVKYWQMNSNKYLNLRDTLNLRLYD
ncbi:septum formation inhibitor Maf [Psychroflexus aestuariivivens]|uniref:septum formation inhibitor Maf n=1 Tax=Psychroflexus aestuariivivens TaxID=1795040 RepID=UPI000FDAC774|nr:septum formation inhibitor Maf [Psychroflexus aestuariivivens]